ncbi:MAG TPA: glycosyltransferase family 4 protein [Kiritimatiellia bacterium]|nr:glycosyltransferase family 4 protein [Kiritimatiellia bacterium]HRZ12752.1 glycosyltransferase family 4 protein [Kiritimatiellia bacterium]HSA18296.1 glycosyltransferase family 4 protein [Kiritimatiellia bacterium]
MTAEIENIGFISTRFAGTDGVTLEAYKWARVLEGEGHRCFWYAGRLEAPPEASGCVPEAFFGHPENLWINERIWGKTARSPLVTRRIRAMSEYLKETLYDFLRRFDVRIMVLENVLAIPMHVPLGLALSELMSETHLPAIGHHHDFYWERTRFSVNAVNDYLDMAFPSRDRELQHVVINQSAQEELARRKAVPSLLVPNVLDFENPPPPSDGYAADARVELGLAPDDILILQPTRIVPRKGIGHAISLVQALADKRCKLVISHEAGDEGTDYLETLTTYAKKAGVDVRFFATRVADTRQVNGQGQKMYTLWDLYPHADFVTYPSFYEGFGNAFLEAVYFKKPVLVNRYDNFARDIEPKGFRCPIMEGYLTREIVAEVRRILEDPAYRQDMVEHNYQVALRHYSYAVLRRRLRTLIINIRGLANV